LASGGKPANGVQPEHRAGLSTPSKGTAVPKAQPNTTGPHIPPSTDRLPLRWAIIGILAAAAGAAGFLCAGPVSAIVTGCAVATAAHRLIA
jgi:hypothetical protein